VSFIGEPIFMYQFCSTFLKDVFLKL